MDKEKMNEKVSLHLLMLFL